MNLLINAALVAVLLFFTRQCGKEEILECTPECVQAKIAEIAKEDVWNPPARVYRYFYNGQKVYFIPQRCCDIPSRLYDENCSLLCAPDGGFSGGGDGMCPDFFSTRTGEVLVWKDDRE